MEQKTIFYDIKHPQNWLELSIEDKRLCMKFWIDYQNGQKIETKEAIFKIPCTKLINELETVITPEFIDGKWACYNVYCIQPWKYIALDTVKDGISIDFVSSRALSASITLTLKDVRQLLETIKNLTA